MKQLYLKCLFLGILTLAGIKAAAYDCFVDGIYYDLNNTNNTASVTYLDTNSSSNESAYSGSVTIPSSFTYNGTNYSVTSIGIYAFLNCSGLTSVTIPNSVTSIGIYAFLNCSGLTSVTIPNSVTSIGDYAFYYCSGLTSVYFNATNCTTMGSNSSVFEGCGSFTTLKIGDNVKNIPDRAFSGCSGLTSVTIPNSVTSIGNYAFYCCSGLTSVAIPNSVTSIGVCAFYCCSGLTSVTIPNSVTSIGNGAFSYCSGLTSVTIPNSVTSIGSSAFQGCSGLTSVTIPNSVTSIGNDAFSGCSGLTSVTIGNSVTSIGNYAFNYCSGLNSVTIPNSVTSIGSSAFQGCSGLTSIVVSSGNTVFDSRNNCNAIIETATNVLITGCKSTTIPNSVTNIGDNAFSGCSGLTSVTIPNSVTSIGIDAFSGCRLENVLTLNSKTVLYNSSFSNRTFQHAMLYIPEGTWREVVYDGGWYLFNNIRETTIKPEALSSARVYTLMDTNTFGYAVYDEMSDEVKIANAFYSIDEQDLNSCWQVRKSAGNNYLYNLGAKKYACINADGRITLSDVATPLMLTEGEKGIMIGDNSASHWGFVKSNIQSDASDITTLTVTPDQEESSVFSLNGLRRSQPHKGFNIIRTNDGKTKKVIVR